MDLSPIIEKLNTGLFINGQWRDAEGGRGRHPARWDRTQRESHGLTVDGVGQRNDEGSEPQWFGAFVLRVLSQNYSSGGKGTRTPNPLLAKQMRYQLRHTPGRVHTLTPSRCVRTIRPGHSGSGAATRRTLRVPLM